MFDIELRPRTFEIGLRVELFNESGYCRSCDMTHRREGIGAVISLVILVVKTAICYKIEDVDVHK